VEGRTAAEEDSDTVAGAAHIVEVEYTGAYGAIGTGAFLPWTSAGCKAVE